MNGILLVGVAGAELQPSSLQLLGELGQSMPYSLNRGIHIFPDRIVTYPTITTPYGQKIVERTETDLGDERLGGFALPDYDEYAVNTRSVFPKDYVDHHERNHLREYLETGVDEIDELINRDISDKQYRKITGKFIDTVTPMEKELESRFTKRYGAENAKGIMKEIRKIKDNYVRANEAAVDIGDITKEFKEDEERERMLEKERLSYIR